MSTRSRAAFVLVLCAACSDSGADNTSLFSTQPPTVTGNTDTLETSGTDPSSSSTMDEETDSETESASDTDKLDFGSSDMGGPMEIAEVFGHSGNTLYRLDPGTLEVETVGPFSGCTASIIDIALDADSNMYGTAFGSLWAIDRTTGACTLITDEGSFTTSLSFVPAGTVDPEVEALVGFDEDQYVRIDPQTGAITNLGTLSDGLESSGDMVAVIDGDAYLTVFGPGCDATDCIVRIDPSTGTVLQNYGSVGYDQVFGLAFWGGKAYGFAREGVLFEVEFVGNSVVTTEIPIPQAPGDLEFFGAGSTTAAPPLEG